MSRHGEQMPSIAGNEDVHPPFDRTGENHVVVGIAGDGVGRSFGRGGHLGGHVDQELFDLAPALRLEAQLPGEDSFQLDHRWLREDELQATVDRLLDYAARRSRRDERGDKDVGVAEDAQDQPRCERISSTSASLSSGPIPRASERSRP